MRGLLKQPLQAFFQTRQLVLAIGGVFLLALAIGIAFGYVVFLLAGFAVLAQRFATPSFEHFARHAQFLAGFVARVAFGVVLLCPWQHVFIVLFAASQAVKIKLRGKLRVGLAVVQIGGRLGWGKRRDKQSSERGKQARFDVGEHFVLAFLCEGDGRAAICYI